MDRSLRARLIPEHSRYAEGEADLRFLLRVEAGRPSRRVRHLVVLLDRSSSMGGQPFRDALATFDALVQALREGTLLTVLAFDAGIARVIEDVTVTDPLRPWLRRQLADLTVGYGTNLGAALQEALASLQGAAGHGHVLVLSDGYPSRGVRAPRELLDLLGHGRGALTVSTVGIGRRADGWLLGALARTGGGAYQHVPAGDSILGAVGAELGLVDALAVSRPRVRFRTSPALQLRGVVTRGPSWSERGDPVFALPWVVAGEPTDLVFGARAADLRLSPLGLLELRWTGDDGEGLLELPLDVAVGSQRGPIEPDVAEAYVAHRLQVALHDAFLDAAGDPVGAHGALLRRVGELRGYCDAHGVREPNLDRALQAVERLRNLAAPEGRTSTSVLAEASRSRVSVLPSRPGRLTRPRTDGIRRISSVAPLPPRDRGSES